jgi:hypothetical protein
MGGSRAGSLIGVLVLYALAVGWLTWPLALVATTQLPSPAAACRFDTPLIEWILAHETHALAGSPSEFLHAGMYHPDPYALFYGPLALGALPLFAPVALTTGNPTLAINAALLGGAVLTAFALHVVLLRTTRSHLAGAIAGWTFLTSRWLLWSHVPTNPFYASLALFPVIIAVVAGAREQVAVRRLLPLLVLQCLADVAYVAAALLVPLGCIAVARTCRRAGRAAGLRLLAVVVATPLCLAPVYAGYLVVAARNPLLAEQTNWRLHGAAAYPWLGQPLTTLPWGPLEDLAPTSVAPVVMPLVVLGALALVIRARREPPSPTSVGSGPTPRSGRSSVSPSPSRRPSSGAASRSTSRSGCSRGGSLSRCCASRAGSRSARWSVRASSPGSHSRPWHTPARRSYAARSPPRSSRSSTRSTRTDSRARSRAVRCPRGIRPSRSTSPRMSPMHFAPRAARCSKFPSDPIAASRPGSTPRRCTEASSTTARS